MSKTLSKRLASFISLLLMAFVFCQGAARAGVVASQLPLDQSAVVASCHDMTGSGQDAMDSPGDCQQLDTAPDSFGQVLSSLDYVPVLAGVLQWASRDEVSLLHGPTFSPPDPATAPPLAIRLQRFRL